MSYLILKEVIPFSTVSHAAYMFKISFNCTDQYLDWILLAFDAIHHKAYQIARYALIGSEEYVLISAKLCDMTEVNSA